MVGFILLCHEVLDALILAPLDPLGDLVAHEVELAAGVGHLVEGKRPHASELAPVVSRHAADERALAVHDLIVRERQDEVLVEGIHDREREQLVVARSPGEVRLAVVERIVHPAHVPLEVEAEASDLRRIGDKRPGRGLLCNHHDIRMVALDRGVRPPDELGCIEVLFRALGVEALLGGVVDTEVHIEHGAHAVHAQAICMVLVKPVEGIGDEEGPDLAFAEVELVGAPVRMLLLLVELVAHEVAEAMGILAEAARHPVEDDTDARLVAGVDEVHELLGRSIAGGRRIVARDLVAPGAIERMLHDRKKLDMGVAHLLHVVYELHGELVVGKVAAACALSCRRLRAVAVESVIVALPGSQMHLEDVERGLQHLPLVAPEHPGIVAPLIVADIRRDGCRIGRALGMEGIRVCLVDELCSRRRLYCVLVALICMDARHEAAPDAARLRLEEVVCVLVPAIEFADEAYGGDARRPDGKAVAVLSVLGGRVGSELVVAAVPLSPAHQVHIV